MNSWHLIADHFGSMRDPYTAAVTMLEMVLYFVLTFSVGRARGKYKVDAPSTDGPMAFKRTYRVHMNTLEQLALHLPLLWMAAVGVGDLFAAAAGILWLLGRLIYIRDYHRDPKTRAPGFFVSLLANIILFVSIAASLARSF